MGILDDAIREHLDLKRRLGADDDELKKLEGEAFGPPTRPGEPDFPEQPPTGESSIGPDTVEAPFDAGAGPATDEEPVAQVPEATIEDAVEVPPEAPEPPHAIEPEPVEPELDTEPEPPAAEAVEAEPVAAEPEPEPEIPADEEIPDAAVPLARELRAIVEPATGETAIRPEDELDLDLDLDLDEPEPDPAATDPSPTPAPADPTPTPTQPEPPIESQDTVEHHFEGALEDTGDVEVVEGEVAEEPAEHDDADSDEEEDEDVLEETPEFLRDQPEDDELWFEQGSPKDFDF
jgi:hypothetical protein